MTILVIDIGGSHIKLALSGEDEQRRFDSHPELSPQDFIKQVGHVTASWNFDRVTVGLPGLVNESGPTEEPGNLGAGWVGFDYAKAFGCPVRVFNDAVLQALGGYRSGRMLFVGFGTGLGTALVTERVIVPLELGCLKLEPDVTYFDRLGKRGLEEFGVEHWHATARDMLMNFRDAFRADEVLIGGGHADLIDPLPPGCRRGGNQDAVTGGIRVWESWVIQQGSELPDCWRVLR